MYAVIKTGGQQYRVCEGDVLAVEKIDSAVGKSVIFDEVLMLANDEKTAIGTPFVVGVSVEANIIDHLRAKKIMVIKFKRRKNYMRRQGHRQNLTKIKITKINT